jgi:diacylglycerol O-acyltransferase / wax synthase
MRARRKRWSDRYAAPQHVADVALPHTPPVYSGEFVVKRLRPLSGLDALFVYLETLGTPMHVASVMRLVPPARRRADYPQRLREHLVARLLQLPVLRRVLVDAPLASGHPAWDERDDIDIDRHVLLRRLPAPGSERQLDALVARLHAAPLPRERPLWRIVVIAGLADGGCALYLQSHHALVDGQAGVQLTRALLDVAPQAPMRRHPADEKAAAASASSARKRPAGLALAAGARHFQRLLRDLPGRLQEVASRGGARALLASLRGSLRLAPRSPFNVQVGATRRYASGHLPLPPLRALAKASGASINDLLLVLVAGALRDYLEARGALPVASLVAAMPVSLRSGADDGGNQVSMAQCTLGTDIDDPLQRLAAIRSDANAVKSRMQSWGALLPTDFPGIGAPLIASGLGGLWRRGRLGERLPPLANLVVSNVPGPPAALWVANARVRAFHPVSIVTHGLGLNITVLSYNGSLELGVVSTPESMPRPDLLVRAIEAGFATLQERLQPESQAASGPKRGRSGPLPA